MILGLGIDLAELGRIERAWKNFGITFAKKILHPEELEQLPQNPVNFLAARFAAKEAAVKALGTGFSQGIWFQDFNVTKNTQGKPLLDIFGVALDYFQQMNGKSVHLSITHSKVSAAAVVIIEG